MIDSRLPRYQQIRDSLARGIARSVWKVGESIPTEADLVKEFGVAVGTVRKAIDALVAEGLVERMHGKGTFVRRPNFGNSLFRFFRYQSATGETVRPQGRVLKRRLAVPPTEVRKALRLDSGQKAVLMKRLRLLDRKVVLCEDIWLPSDLFQEILTTETSLLEPLLYPAYENLFGVLIVRAEETLSIGSADAPTSKALGLSKNAPVMLIERCAFDQTGRPVEWRCSQGSVAGFRYKVDVR